MSDQDYQAPLLWWLFFGAPKKYKSVQWRWFLLPASYENQPSDFPASIQSTFTSIVYQYMKVGTSIYIWLVVGPPLWKIWTSIGMISNPIYGKIKHGNQTTNQISIYYMAYQSTFIPTKCSHHNASVEGVDKVSHNSWRAGRFWVFRWLLRPVKLRGRLSQYQLFQLLKADFSNRNGGFNWFNQPKYRGFARKGSQRTTVAYCEEHNGDFWWDSHHT